MAFGHAVQMKLEDAGIRIGDSPSSDIIVHHDSAFNDILFKGTLGIGESYVKGKWDSPCLRDVLIRGIRAQVPLGTLNIPYRLLQLAHAFTNPEDASKAQKIADHYNTDNRLYQRMLGSEMAYTCAYFGRGAKTLDEAQRDKLQLICEKINLQPGQRVLDIGCGFGSYARFAASEFGTKVTGITISEQQLELGRERCAGLDNVELLFMNYLDLLKNYPPESFDHIVSLGMFEHVGPKNYVRFMEITKKLLKPNGLFLLHTISGEGYDPWINKYIFPGGVLPNIKQLAHAFRAVGFKKEDEHNFGFDYSRTLAFWRQNFNAAWPELRMSGKFGDVRTDEPDRFYRMWIFYLTSCEALFYTRNADLFQFVLSPNGVEGGYRSVR